MRIVAGMLRGKTIDAPEGKGTRPTTDRVREALFSSLYSLRGGFEQAQVLDAFAGSGALGLEALSRGGARCTFYERDPKAVKVLRRNVERCDLSPEIARVIAKDVLASPPKSTACAFDLVFLDPPYDYAPDGVMVLLASLREAAVLDPDAIIAYEHAASVRDDVARAAEDAGFTLHAVKKYGKTSISILRP